MGQWIPDRLREQMPAPDRVGPPPETAGEVAVEQIMRLLTKTELGPGHLILWSSSGEKLFEIDVPPPERKGKFAVRYGAGSSFTPNLTCAVDRIELLAEGMSFVRRFPSQSCLRPKVDTFYFDFQVFMSGPDEGDPFAESRGRFVLNRLDDAQRELDAIRGQIISREELNRHLSYDD